MKKVLFIFLVLIYSHNGSYAFNSFFETINNNVGDMSCEVFSKSDDEPGSNINYLKNGEDIFEYNIIGLDDKYKFNGIEYDEPIKGRGFNYYNDIILNDNHYIYTNDNDSVYLLDNGKFIKYNLIKLDNGKIKANNNKYYEVLFIEKGDKYYLIISYNDHGFFHEIDINNYEGIEFDKLIVSDDNKNYLLTIKQNSNYKVIYNGKISSDSYLNIMGIDFLKDYRGFGFFGLVDIDYEKKEGKIIFSSNFEKRLDIGLVDIDGNEFYSIGNNLFHSNKFTVSVLKNGVYYYGITNNNKFKLYKGNKLIINTDGYYIDNSISSKNDEFETILLNDGKGTTKIISNVDGTFKEVYNLKNGNEINGKGIIFDGVDEFRHLSIDDIYYYNNILYYKINLTVNDDTKIKSYSFITNNLNEFQGINLEFESIISLKGYLDNGGNDLFLGSLSNGERIFFDLSGKKKKISKDGLILGITNNFDIILLKELEGENKYSIFKNDKLLLSYEHNGQIGSFDIIFSDDYSKFLINYKDKNGDLFFYFNGKNIPVITYPDYSTDLNFIGYRGNDYYLNLFIGGKLFSYDSHSFNNLNDIRKIDNNTIFIGDGREAFICDLSKVEFKEAFNIKNKKYILKKLIVSKFNIEKTNKLIKYKKQIDSFVKNISDNKLISVYEKLNKLDINSKSLRKYKIILEYMKYKIANEIWKRDSIEKEEI